MYITDSPRQRAHNQDRWDADPLLVSAAETCGVQVIGIVLSGGAVTGGHRVAGNQGARRNGSRSASTGCRDALHAARGQCGGSPRCLSAGPKDRAARGLILLPLSDSSGWFSPLARRSGGSLMPTETDRV